MASLSSRPKPPSESDVAPRARSCRSSQVAPFAFTCASTVKSERTASAKISAETGLPYHSVAEGESLAGIYRQRVSLASGRFAMIDDGLGFSLVAWTPSLERQLGRQVSGVLRSDGMIDWSFGRKRGLEL